MIVTWFPCYLQPLSVFSLGPWNVKPGLRAGPMSDGEKALWRDSGGHPPLLRNDSSLIFWYK